jgi:hypothetical protein
MNLILGAVFGVAPLLQFGALEQKSSIEFLLQAGASVFSLVLFAVTLYAWSRRGKQSNLLLVAFAFFLYFSKLLIEILPLSELHDELVGSIMDFATLTMLFLALVVRPHRVSTIKPKRDSDQS